MDDNCKILFLGGKYFDNADAGGISCKNLFNECKKQKIEAYVLGYTKDNEFDGLKELENEIAFYYKKNVNNISKSKIASIKRCFKPALDNTLIDKYCEYVYKLIEEKEINMVVGIYFPIETVEILKRIKEKFNHVITINYEVDSATEISNYSSRLSKFHNMAMINYLNSRYESIDNVFIMKSHREHFIKTPVKHKNKAIIIDTPFLLDEIKPVVSNKNTVDFIYAGLLDKDYYSPLPILDFFASNKDKDNWRLHFISRGNCEELIEEASKKDHRIIQHGYVEYSKTQQEIAKANFLLSIEYKQKPSSIPAKVFNYFSAGKPVIHFCSGKYSYFVENYINKYDFGLGVIASREDSSALINQFIIKTLDKHAKYDEVSKVFEMNTPTYSINKMKECFKYI